MIKINQLTSVAQASRLKAHLDVAGICIAKQKAVGSPYVDAKEALELRRALPGVPLSVSFLATDGFEIREMAEVLAEVGADYFEFTPVDFAKVSWFDEQLCRLSEIRLPKIANGYFVLADDTSFVGDATPFQRLQAIGVRAFQFEVQSAVDPSFKLSARDLQKTNDFFAQLNVLVTDVFDQIQDYPLRAVAGYFFNLASSQESPSYDGAREWPASSVLRVLRGRGTAG